MNERKGAACATDDRFGKGEKQSSRQQGLNASGRSSCRGCTEAGAKADHDEGRARILWQVNDGRVDAARDHRGSAVGERAKGLLRRLAQLLHGAPLLAGRLVAQEPRGLPVAS